MTQLLDIPGELIDTILAQIEDPHTLLQLAVASKQLTQDILVSHLRYRVVRCDRAAEASAVWKDIAAYPARARNIRVLHIGPRSEYASDVLAAVEVMSGLKRFSWEGPGPGTDSEAISKSLFTALARVCPDLRDVRLCARRSNDETFNLNPEPDLDDEEEDDMQRSVFRSIRWVSRLRRNAITT